MSGAPGGFFYSGHDHHFSADVKRVSPGTYLRHGAAHPFAPLRMRFRSDEYLDHLLRAAKQTMSIYIYICKRWM